jgi:predicted homoserine dehydrogenase-like protein
MLDELKRRKKEGRPINIGLTGLGAMGLGVAYQIGRTPGMKLSFVADYNEAAARKGAEVYGKPTNILKDGMAALKDPNIPCDVFVEATNSVVAAYEYCMAAI